MASWTSIPNSSLETGAPARSVDALAFRDNPIAIAEGATGAPGISGAVINIGVYDIGSVISASKVTSGTVNPGSNVSGSTLRLAGISSVSDGSSPLVSIYGSGISGTWQCVGYSYDDGTYRRHSLTLWKRIA